MIKNRGFWRAELAEEERGMTDTKRIAKNTLFLYFRQILIIAVSLYTARESTGERV